IIKAWQAYFAVLKQDMANALGDISFTADIWSDKKRGSYLGMTAHWIAEDPITGTLTLRSALIAFHRLRGNHTGKSIAKTIVYLLDRAGVTTKVR
ncbi:hypothetical protein BJ138DRAFT_1019655, partial [Hygrophoropsis aurantiaca]